jgi:hypothetical protein
LPAHPIAEAVPYAPVNASFARLSAQSDFAGVTRGRTIVPVVRVPAAGIVDAEVGAAALEDPLSHADVRHATTTTPTRRRVATGA